MNRKFDRFKQWAGERMGGEVKTNLSDDFKAMETEMNVRHDGVDRMHKSMAAYVKSISKRSEGDDKERTLPIGYLGTSMVSHGEDFDAYSEYGRCLTMFGRTEERVARAQEAYIAQANTTWLESLDRSMTQMKEYQNSRKKLDSRRLAYDTSLSKMQKAKKEDFRVEEELRSQKVKYEEANEDVFRRMQDIKESEGEGVDGMAGFLEAQLKYHEQCLEVLTQLKNDWPGAGQGSPRVPGRRATRANTAHAYYDHHEPLHEENANAVEPRPIIRSNKPVYSESPPSTYDAEYYQRPAVNRTSTFEGPTQLRQESYSSSDGSATPYRATSENLSARINQLRPVSRVSSDPYVDQTETYSHPGSSPDGWYGSREQSVSPVPSYGNGYAVSGGGSPAMNGFKKGPPPPPPSRAKKPPPPPPVKRPIFAGQ